MMQRAHSFKYFSVIGMFNYRMRSRVLLEISPEKPDLQYKLLEYQHLRQELVDNKKMVFERAIVIVAAGLAAGLVANEVEGIQLVGIPTIGAIGFSLWLTANRLESNSRIISYIQLFHENENKFQWVGWETALRLHRIWSKRNDSAQDKLLKYRNFNVEQYDNISFYRAIFVLHLFLAFVVAMIMSFISWTSGPPNTPLGLVPIYVVPAINCALALFLSIWSYRYRPSMLQDRIEINRRVWLEVFKSYAAGDLKVT